MKLVTGIITQVDEDNCRARVTLPDCDDLLSPWLDLLFKGTKGSQDYAIPGINEQVRCLLDDDAEDGCILGAIYSSADRPKISDGNKRRVDFRDGAFIEYDCKESALTVGGGIKSIGITTQSDITVETQAAATVIAHTRAEIQAPLTHVTGDLEVDGTLTTTGKLTFKGGMEGHGGDGHAVVITGDIHVVGSIDATGTIMDTGGNSNHHSH